MRCSVLSCSPEVRTTTCAQPTRPASLRRTGCSLAMKHQQQMSQSRVCGTVQAKAILGEGFGVLTLQGQARDLEIRAEQLGAS